MIRFIISIPFLLIAAAFAILGIAFNAVAVWICPKNEGFL